MYTFQDWNEGKVTLDCTYYFKEHRDDNIVIVKYSDFNEENQILIKEAQKEYFNQLVHDETNRLIDAFISRYNHSEFQIDLLNNEVKQLFDILYSEIPCDKFIELKHWGTIFEYEELAEIRRLFTRHKVDGYKLDYSHQNSPLSKNFDISLSHEFRMESLYNYYKFLEGIIEDAPNVFNSYHWNKNCFKLFKFLNVHVTAKTKKSKYALIYHFLKAYSGYAKIKGFYLFDFSHAEYIEFITENYYRGFSKPIAPKMNKPDYFDEVLPKLNELENLFRESQKTAN
jgi:hypothetical protein